MHSGQEDVRRVIYEACERLGISNSEAYELRFLSLIIDAEKKIGTGNPVGMIYNSYEPKNALFPFGRKLLIPHQVISDLYVLDKNGDQLDSCKYKIRGNYVLFSEPQTEIIILKFKGLILDFENQPFISTNHFEAVVSYLVYMETTTRYHSKKAPYYQYKDTREWWQDRLAEARGDDFFSTKEQFEEASLELYGITENIFPCPTKPTIDNDYPFIPDTTAPIITLIGSSTISIMENGNYTDKGATAIDDVDGDVTSNIVISGDTVDVNVPGTYIIKYDVKDSSGNEAIQVTRTVIITAIELPQRPGRPNVTVVETNVKIVWNANGNGPDINYVLEIVLYNDNNYDWSTASIYNTSQTNYELDLPRDRYLTRVKAVNLKGEESDYSTDNIISTLDETPPEHQGWSTITKDGSTINLSWHEATDNVGIGNYILKRKINGSDNSTYVTEVLPGNQLSKQITLEDAPWFFTIQAIDTSGNVSATAGTVVQLDTQPPSASILSVELLYDGDYARLNWTEAEDAYSTSIKYILYATLTSDLDWSNARQLETQFTLSTVFDNLETGVWKFKAEAIDNSGNYSTSNIVEKEVNTNVEAPTDPINLTAVLLDNKVSLDWIDSVDVNEIIYEIHYTLFNDFEWGNSIILNSNTSNIDIELDYGNYKFKVRAKNSYNLFSNYSNTATISYENNELPDAPTSLIGVVLGNEFSLNWDSSIRNPTYIFYYELEYTLEIDTDWSSSTIVKAYETHKILLLNAGKYKFRVRIKTTSPETVSGWSNELTLESFSVNELDNTNVFYGQCDIDTVLGSQFFEQLNSISNNEIVNENVSLYAESVTSTIETIEVPYLGSPFSNQSELNKVTHFVAIPKGLTMSYSVNSEFASDIFYDEFNNRYSKLSIIINDSAYTLWVLSLENPLGSNINVTIKKVIDVVDPIDNGDIGDKDPIDNTDNGSINNTP